MKKINILATLILVLLLGLSEIFAGGGNRTGTGGAAQLLIPVGVRGISMGEQGVSTAYGIEALFWNPAGISKTDHSAEVTFSHMNYIADIGVEYGAVSGNFTGFGVLSLYVKSLSVGDIARTTTAEPDGDGTYFSPQFLTAGLSFSRQLTERISVGLTANYITESMGNATASGVGFDIGVMYENLADFSGLNFGIVLKNLGPQMRYDGSALYVEANVTDYNRPPQYYKITSASFELPTFFQLGVSYMPMLDEVNSLLATATFQNNNFSDDEYRLGLEYGYNKMFFVRGGYSLAPQAPTDNYIYGFTAGVGFNYQFEGIDLDAGYAYRDAKYFNGNHIFSLSLGF